MPVIGSFHAVYWRARANAPPPTGVNDPWMYPGWQSSVTLSMAIWGLPVAVLAPTWAHLRWYGRLARALWGWRQPAQQARLDGWIERLSASSAGDLAVFDHVAAVLEGPYWAHAQALVQACATSPKFHQPEQWVAYSRAVKADGGQAQNIWRHVKVVHELKVAHAEITNPEAHLVTELAYQRFAYGPRVFKVRHVVKRPGLLERAKERLAKVRLTRLFTAT